MIPVFLLFLLAPTVFCPRDSVGAEPPPWHRLPELAHGTVAAIADPAVLRLTDDRLIRLAGLIAPGQGGESDRDLGVAREIGDAVRVALSAAALGRPLILRRDGPPTDRHDRLPGQAFIHADAAAGETWLQGLLLGQGLARVDGRSEPPALLAALLALEADARAARRGLWAHAAYRPRSPDETRRLPGSFQLVTGSVMAVGRADDWTFLNFGADWRQDFTIRINKSMADRLRRSDLAPETLAGRKVLVRGWLGWRNGAEVLLRDVGQLSLVE